MGTVMPRQSRVDSGQPFVKLGGRAGVQCGECTNHPGDALCDYQFGT